MKIKIYDNSSHRFPEESRLRRKNASVLDLATRKENCHHGKHHSRFNEILGNLSKELTSHDNQNKVVKLKLKFNLKKLTNNSKTLLRKYTQNADYEVINRLHRMRCKVHGSFQYGNYAAAVCSRARNTASSDDTCNQQDFCKSRLNRTLVCLINSKRMDSDSAMVKRNNQYKKRKSVNRICIKLEPSCDKDRNNKVQHVISAFNNILRSYVLKTETGNRMTVTSENNDKRFVDTYGTKGELTKRFSYKINMLQRCLNSTSENLFLHKLKNEELSKCKEKINKCVILRNSPYKDVNKRTKYCSSTLLNKSNVKKTIRVIGCRSDTNTCQSSKRYLKNKLSRKEVNHYSQYYTMPLKCQRRAKDREIDLIANKRSKKISYEIKNYGQLRRNEYSQKCKQYSLPSCMLMRHPFLSCYKGEYNVFNLQYIIPKNKLGNKCTYDDISDYKKYGANTLSLHELSTKHTDSNSNYSKSLTTWYNRPNSSLISFTDTRPKYNNEYRRETPFCFEIPPIETHAVHVKLKRYKYEDCGVPTSQNTSLCCHTNEEGGDSCKPKKAMILGRLTEEIQKIKMQLKDVICEGKMFVEKFVNEKKQMILDRVQFLNAAKSTKPKKICVPCPNRRQFPKDVGFRTTFNFNIGIRKIPRIKPIKSSSICDSGKQ